MIKFYCIKLIELKLNHSKYKNYYKLSTFMINYQILVLKNMIVLKCQF